MTADLRFGRWQDVLAGVECDALIVDAPYSSKTHAGHAAGHAGDRRGYNRQDISYNSFSEDQVAELVQGLAPRVRGWFVSITDDVLAPTWSDALRSAGRYVFAPLPFVETGSRVRLTGDGPSSWSCWIVVARPRTPEFVKWGTLPGSYVGPSERKPVIGGKSLGLMRAIVRDYTKPGDLICDPCAGGGTTLLAALSEGRRAVGAEMDPKHFEIARKRLAAGYTPPLLTEGEDKGAA